VSCKLRRWPPTTSIPVPRVCRPPTKRMRSRRGSQRAPRLTQPMASEPEPAPALCRRRCELAPTGRWHQQFWIAVPNSCRGLARHAATLRLASDQRGCQKAPAKPAILRGPCTAFSSLGTASQMARVVSIAAELYVTTRRCGDAAAPGAARLATAPDGTADISPARTPVLGTHAGCLSDSWNVCGSSQPRAPLRGWRCLEACPCGGSDWPRSSLRSFA
jgi:hypothetical protein